MELFTTKTKKGATSMLEIRHYEMSNTRKWNPTCEYLGQYLCTAEKLIAIRRFMSFDTLSHFWRLIIDKRFLGEKQHCTYDRRHWRLLMFEFSCWFSIPVIGNIWLEYLKLLSSLGDKNWSMSRCKIADKHFGALYFRTSWFSSTPLSIHRHSWK